MTNTTPLETGEIVTVRVPTNSVGEGPQITVHVAQRLELVQMDEHEGIALCRWYGTQPGAEFWMPLNVLEKY